MYGIHTMICMLWYVLSNHIRSAKLFHHFTNRFRDCHQSYDFTNLLSQIVFSRLPISQDICLFVLDLCNTELSLIEN